MIICFAIFDVISQTKFDKNNWINLRYESYIDYIITSFVLQIAKDNLIHVIHVQSFLENISGLEPNPSSLWMGTWLAFMHFSLQTEKETSSCLKREQAFLLIYILEP